MGVYIYIYLCVCVHIRINTCGDIYPAADIFGDIWGRFNSRVFLSSSWILRGWVCRFGSARAVPNRSQNSHQKEGDCFPHVGYSHIYSLYNTLYIPQQKSQQRASSFLGMLGVSQTKPWLGRPASRAQTRGGWRPRTNHPRNSRYSPRGTAQLETQSIYVDFTQIICNLTGRNGPSDTQNISESADAFCREHGKV